MSKEEDKKFSKKCQNRDIDNSDSRFLINVLDGTNGYITAAFAFTTQKNAIKILGISHPTFRKYCRIGFITRYRLGARYYFRLDELHEAKKNIF